MERPKGATEKSLHGQFIQGGILCSYCLIREESPRRFTLLTRGKTLSELHRSAIVNIEGETALRVRRLPRKPKGSEAREARQGVALALGQGCRRLAEPAERQAVDGWGRLLKGAGSTPWRRQTAGLPSNVRGDRPD